MLLTIDVPAKFVQDVFHLRPAGTEQEAASCRFQISEEDGNLWKLSERLLTTLGMPSIRDIHIEVFPEIDSMTAYTEDGVHQGVIEPILWVLLRAGAAQALRVTKMSTFHLNN